MKPDIVKMTYRGAPFALAFVCIALLTSATYADDDESNLKLTDAAREHRSRLDFDGKVFSGPALDRMLAAAPPVAEHAAAARH